MTTATPFGTHRPLSLFVVTVAGGGQQGAGGTASPAPRPGLGRAEVDGKSAGQSHMHSCAPHH